MRVKINYKKLVDSPYSIQHKDAFIFEDFDAISQLVNELKNGNASTYLISGYRGSGKTSIINRIEEDLDGAIFVKMSLSKHENYNILLRKLIRHLYLAYIQTLHYEKSKEDVSDFSNSFTLLFERTFNEITFAKSQEEKKDQKRALDVVIDLRKLIPIIFTAISGWNLFLNVFSIRWELDVLFFIASIIWFLSTIKFSYSKNHSATNLDLISRKSLYDDEISEFHLLGILRKLKEQKVNVVIVFDELDKIDDLEKINTVISELKFLLLSGLAHFIVVSGQTLYYQFEKSFYKDDAVMLSLFSKTVHVQLLKIFTLKQYILGLILNNELKENSILNQYIDSLILQSRRIPRRLSNIIRNLIIWDNNEAYLEINETAEMYKADSKFCHLLNGIIENDLADYSSNRPEIDFYTSMLHLYAFKIKLQKGNKFESDTIVKLVQEEAYDLKTHPKSYFIAAQHFCKSMLDKLVDAGLLNLELVEGRALYSWIETPNLEPVNEHIEESGFPQSKFLEQFKELEQYVREIFFEVTEYSTAVNNIVLPDMLKELVDRNVYTTKLHVLEKFQDVYQLRNDIIHGGEIKIKDLDKIIDSRIHLNRLKSEIIEGYLYYITKRYLSEKGYVVLKDNDLVFDFAATNEPIHIFFDTKYSSSENFTKNINDIIRKYENSGVSSRENFYYVLFFYQPYAKKSYDSFYKRFYDKLNNDYPQYKNNIYMFYLPVAPGDSNMHRLEEFIQNVLYEIEQGSKAISNVLKGNWLNEWNYNAINKKGQEQLEITVDGRYLIDGKHTFTIINFAFEEDKQTVNFIKYRIDDGTRLLNNLKITNNGNVLIGMEKNLDKGDEYDIRYTKSTNQIQP